MSSWSTSALPTVEPLPVTTCSHSGGQAAVVDQQLGEGDAAERRLAGRLQHHRAAGGDGRRQLVGHEVEREVERADRADDADRHPQREAELALARWPWRRAAPCRRRACGPRRRRSGTCSTARSASPRAVLIGLAASTAMISAKWSRRSASRRAAVSRISARFQRGSGPAASAALAIATARSTSAGPHTGTRPITAPSYGAVTSDDSVPVKRSPANGMAWTAVESEPDAAMGRPYFRPWRPDLGRSHPFLDWPGPLAFAHRGGASEAPENTLPAFQNAVDLGYRYLETDVHVTADGVVVAFHDDDLSRTCGRPGLIHELPWAEVATARVDGTEPIPRLDELLERVPGRAASTSTARPTPSSSRSATCCTRPAPSIGCASAAFSDRRLRRIRQRFGSRAVHQRRAGRDRAAAVPRHRRAGRAGGPGADDDAGRQASRRGVRPALPSSAASRSTCGRSTSRPRWTGCSTSASTAS